MRHLEGLLVDVRFVPHVRLPGFAEEDELLEEEHVAQTFPLPEGDRELILAYQLALLLQVHLQEVFFVSKETVTRRRATG